ncbi:MAG: hypothetical protein P9X24_04090 [Candidatus Hatepunaea meridiana]|nr:hypothetical protein [Candidatus Hatepunaea meridiana]
MLRTLIVVCSCFFLICSEASAMFYHRTEFPTLDVRSRGTGDVNLGVTGPLSGIENPAYLNQTVNFSAQFEYSKTPHSEYLIPFIVNYRTEYGVFGLSAIYYDMGKLDVYNDLGQNEGSEHLFNVNTGIHYANRINDNLLFGIGVGYEESFYNNGTETTFQVGCLLTGLLSDKDDLIDDNNGLSIGISFTNIGQKNDLSWEYRKCYPPWMGKLNVSWDIIHTEDHHIILGGMFRMLLVDYHRQEIHWGDEYSTGIGFEGKYGVLSIRLGYINEFRRFDWPNRCTTIMPGFGLDFGKYYIDFSTRDWFWHVTNMNWLSIGVRF